ncbi:hypothetical protein HY212_01115 [Candidatus Pacearchaeota archaeon]|nr:hypothetical protein [Candidatus Pacearchaeota archaeon]
MIEASKSSANNPKELDKRYVRDFLEWNKDSEIEHKVLDDGSVVKIRNPTKRNRCYRLDILFPQRNHQHSYPVSDFDQAWNTYCAIESAKDFKLMVDELGDYDSVL